MFNIAEDFKFAEDKSFEECLGPDEFEDA